jgi:hypothetical protein
MSIHKDDVIVKAFTAAVALAVSLGLAGCAEQSSPNPAASSSMENSYSYPSTWASPLSKYSNHTGPYDNTGNGPGESGLEGGGG